LGQEGRGPSSSQCVTRFEEGTLSRKQRSRYSLRKSARSFFVLYGVTLYEVLYFIGSTTTAVPYARTSVTPCMTSVAS